MRNRYFKGIEGRIVLTDDPNYAKLAGSWGMWDLSSGKFLSKCFFANNHKDNFEEALDLANKVLLSSAERVVNLADSRLTWDHDDYIPSMIVKSWVHANHDVLPLMIEHIGEVTERKARIKKANKKKRGRPRKSLIDGEVINYEPKPRGRPRKPVDENAEPKEKRGRGRPRKNPVDVVVDENKKGRGRPRKDLVEVTSAPSKENKVKSKKVS